MSVDIFWDRLFVFELNKLNPTVRRGHFCIRFFYCDKICYMCLTITGVTVCRYVTVCSYDHSFKCACKQCNVQQNMNFWLQPMSFRFPCSQLVSKSPKEKLKRLFSSTSILESTPCIWKHLWSCFAKKYKYITPVTQNSIFNWSFCSSVYFYVETPSVRILCFRDLISTCSYLLNSSRCLSLICWRERHRQFNWSLHGSTVFL